jgi:hypothetical protein
MAFVQIIEYRTDRPDEVEALLDEWEEASPDVTPGFRGLLCADRDNPGTYVNIVEFPSYEVAMENSNRPETGELAAKLASLCDGPPVFRNLEVLREM